jgi:glutathione synthase/RimK-type ligase-like ATP-grasp enzyme
VPVLVVAPAGDPHADAVRARLRARGVAHDDLDLARFPRSAAVVLAFGAAPGGTYLVRDGERGLDLGACESVFWRRPRPAAVDDDLRGDARRLAQQDCQAALAGLWHSLRTRWVNDPVRQDVASRKPFQLATAAGAGLRVPRTVVTNDRDAARAFLATCRGERGIDAVVKRLTVLGDAPSPTRRVLPEHLERLPTAPVILQEYVDGADLRVTLVGRRVFAMEIDARRSACPEDCRVDRENLARTARPVELPVTVLGGLAALRERLGLEYAAFDLRRTDGGEHVFLEVNPTGEWLWVEELVGAPITEAVTDLLAGADS